MIGAHALVTEDLPPGPRPPLLPADARQLALDAHARAVILVEGWSDQAAIDTLARRFGFELAAEGVLTLPIGGVTNLGAFVQVLGPAGLDLRVAGLCDAAEERYAGRTLARAGMATDGTRAGLAARGFFVCDADLEDELIRAVGHAKNELLDLEELEEEDLDRVRETYQEMARKARESRKR